MTKTAVVALGGNAAIKALLAAGVLVIAAGGGGIPLAAGPAGPAGGAAVSGRRR